MAGAQSELAGAATILVVDDDKGLARLVEKALQREGFRTASASSFEEAVAWLRDRRPDLMLLDLKLQDIGGQELVDYLTVNGQQVPFIIITGQGDERVAVAMMKRGAMDYLVKDVDFLQFVPEVVRRALRQLERDKKLSAAEDALRRSEANLAKAQQIAHLGSYEVNIPSSSEDFQSDQMYRLLGLDRREGELSHEGYQERMVHPADRNRYREAMERATRQGAAFELEHRIVRADGSIRHVQLVVEPVLDAAGHVRKLVATVLDSTHRRRAELRQQVQYSITRVLTESSTLAEAAPAILKIITEKLDWDLGEFWQMESKTQTLRCLVTRSGEVSGSDFERTTRSQQFARGSGLPGRAWEAGKPLWIADMAQDQGWSASTLALSEGIRCALALPLLLGTEILGVIVFLSRNSRPPDGELLQMFTVLASQIGQFIDRRRAEEALRREHAFSSAVLDTSAALVVVLDRRGRIIRFNRACEQTTGYNAMEVLGQPFWELFVVPEEVELTKGLFEKIRAGAYPNRHENDWLTRGGERRVVAWSNSALLDDEGGVEYVISIGIDVTERRRLEQDILHISELEQRRIGQDLHDGLCQHLAGTELMAEIVAQKLARKSKADAGRVEGIARHVREAISQTRLLARGLSPVVLESEGLMSALQELTETTGHMFRVDCKFQCKEPVLVDDHTWATHLYRIAQEAISNGVRHGRAKHLVVSLLRTPGRIALEIRDDGGGLPKDLSKSRGMGLRIMQYRAAMMGGSLTVQNQPGGGTMVACALPERTQWNADPHHEHVKENKGLQENSSHRR